MEKQLISSHSGTVNLQLDDDSRVAMKLMSFGTMSSKEFANQLVMFIRLNPATLINLQLDNDNLVAMKLMSPRTMSSKELANQLAMFIPTLKSAGND